MTVNRTNTAARIPRAPAPQPPRAPNRCDPWPRGS